VALLFSLHRKCLALLLGSAFAVLALMGIDRLSPGGASWMLLGLSTTAGFAHGALDIELLFQKFQPLSSAIRLAGIYFLAVLLMGWALSDSPQIALCFLLLMSAWHFGEDYGRWNGVAKTAGVVTRLVVGGAPVALPVLLSHDAMSSLWAITWSADAGRFWLHLAQVWVLLFLAWMVLAGLPRYRLMCHAWSELAGVILLNAVFSPMMAFALYFGAYHAPLHIWRVWSNRPTTGHAQAFSRAAWAGIFALTLVLAGILWWGMAQAASAPVDWLFALRWLVLSLTALTLPHLMLVSLCATTLSRHRMAMPTLPVRQFLAPQCSSRPDVATIQTSLND
jgi:beta-carotene 15,15'-dioxygenase